MGIAAILGGLSGACIGALNGAQGWNMFGYIIGGASIGALSVLAGGALSASGVAAWWAGAVSGAVGGAGFSGLSTSWDAHAMAIGALKGAASGFLGGAVSSAIGGGWGAAVGGAVSSGTNTALNGGDFRQVAASSILGGLLSYASYELSSYIGWRSSGKQLASVDISYDQYKTVQADYQRSRFWGKEYGGFLMNDGSTQRFPRAWRHEYGIEPPSGNGVEIPDGARAMYHTHWDVPNKTIIVDSFGNDVSKMTPEQLISVQNPHKTTTERGHSPYDYISIDSFVINRYETSFSPGNSGRAFIIQDTFFRFFPLWFYCRF